MFWTFEIQGSQHMILHVCKKMTFPSHPTEKVRCQGLQREANAQPNISFEQYYGLETVH